MIGFLLVFFYSDLSFSASELPHDGQIRFFVYHLDELLEIKYLDKNGKWIEGAYEKIRWLCRSRGDQAVYDIDRRLIELADHLQDHFQVDTIEIISCFRSQEFNRSLKEKGASVVEESLHIKGMAMDFHIDEIPEAVLRDYLLQLEFGGVGYYGDRLMVHMDFGPVRRWHGGDFLENTKIGVFNEMNPAKIRTDRLFYFVEHVLRLDSQGILDPEFRLQKFFRGKWMTVHEFPDLKTWKITDEFGYGKFRLRYENGEVWQHSNEFYIKKL